VRYQISFALALLWTLASCNTYANPYAIGDDDYSLPPKPASAASSAAGRPKLQRRDAVANFKLDAKVKASLDNALKKYADDTKLGLANAENALKAAKKEKDPNKAKPLFQNALPLYEQALSRTQRNDVRIIVAYLNRELATGNYDLAKSYLLQVLNDENASNSDLVNAAAELRELSLVSGYTLTLNPTDISVNARGIAKILSSNTIGSLDLGSVARPLAAANLFKSSGDSVWAAQMYRECLQNDPSHAVSEAALTSMNLGKAPLYPRVVSVNSHYTTQKKDEDEYNFNYLEEEEPQVDVWGSIRSHIVTNFYVAGRGWKRVSDTDVEDFKATYLNMLGVDFKDFRGLFLQSYVYVLMRNEAMEYADAVDFCKKSTFQNLTQKVTAVEIPAASDDQGSGLQFVQTIKLLSVDYLQTDDERKPYLLTIDKGVIKQAGKPFDTAQMSTAFSGAGSAIYVLSPDGLMYSGSHKVSKFHHSSFLAAADAAGAGELKVTQGKISEISNKSGHYRPGLPQLVQTLEFLESKGVDLAGIKKVNVAGISKKSKKSLLQPWNGNASQFLKMYKTDQPKFKTQIEKMFP
jgi:hypothetical protein